MGIIIKARSFPAKKACRIFIMVICVALTGASSAHAETSTSLNKEKILYYRNPMGLSDTSPVPKKDAMGMDYVPVYASVTKEAVGTVQISPRRIQELGVTTAVIGKRDLSRPIHAVGNIEIDERRQTIVAPRFGGWIEKLYVDTTGARVKKGDPLFVFYSPELANIEAEYPFARSMKALSISKQAINGTIEKLRNLAVPQEEIERLEREHTANDHITFRAPADGIVMDKKAIEGMKFSSGQTLYRLVDLSDVWVIADVYAQDLARVAVGQPVKVTINAYPNETFKGVVGFIYPDIDKDTRTAKVRIDLPNPDGSLRLNMYVNVIISGTPKNDALAVPVSAILDSGTKQVVLIDMGHGRFRPQSVKIGTRNDDYAEVLEGLHEGDRVVTSANFLIDSESNIRAALQGFAPPEAKP